MFIGNFPEELSQEILVGIIFVGRLGIPPINHWLPAGVRTNRTSSRPF